jgi:hypothetical protein
VFIKIRIMYPLIYMSTETVQVAPQAKALVDEICKHCNEEGVENWMRIFQDYMCYNKI